MPANHGVLDKKATLDKKAIALRLVGGAVLLWGLLSLIGLLITKVLDTGPAHRTDLGVDVWFAAHRTPIWNDITYVGTTLAQTWTALGVTVVVVLLLRWRLGRWHESLVLITVMAGELLIFLSVTLIISRHRPPVHRLDAAPETSSFPSGHTAAAVALYGCLAILVFWIYGRTPLTRAIVAVLCLIPFYVAFSRLYRGMHYPSDVLAGALLGGLWLLLVVRTLLYRQAAVSRATARRPAVSHAHARRRTRLT
jgi:membrane-associated phospholipid phosphatase